MNNQLSTWFQRALPRAWIQLPADRPTLYLFVRISIFVGLFTLSYRALLSVTHLPVASYGESILVFELLQHLGPLLVAVVVALTALLIRYGNLLIPWSAIEHGREIRFTIVFLAALVAWPFCTYGYNLYFDQGHYFDRFLLAALVPLIFVRPAFVFPYLVVIFTIGWQFDQPLGDLLWAHKLQVIHIITLFATFLGVSVITGQRRTQDFLFVAGCVIAAAYWLPGLTKLNIGWLGFGNHHHMPLAAYQHGWLAFADADSILTFSQILKKFDLWMQIFVIALEIGALAFLWHRRVAIVLLALFVVFHLGVFAVYGYLFWTWIFLDIVFLILLIRLKSGLDFFSRPHFALSVILIGFSSAWCNPASLAWFDTRLTYTFRYEATGVSGQTYALPPRFFAPYGDIFTMANFGYLVSDHSRLSGPYAITQNREFADAIQGASSGAEIFDLEASIGRATYDAQRSGIFYSFISQYLANWNAHPGMSLPPNIFRPPPQFWSFGRGNVYTGSEPISQVRVIEITTLYHHDQLDEIRSIVLNTLDIHVGEDSLRAWASVAGATDRPASADVP